MPRLPQIVSSASPDSAKLSIGASQLPGEAAARAGSAVSDIGNEMLARSVELSRSRQLMEKTSEAALAANDTYLGIINDPNLDNEKLSQTVQDGLKQVHDKIGKDITDPEVRNHFDQNFDGLTVQHVVQARSLQIERGIDSARATLNTSNQTYADLAGDATGQQLDAYMAQISGNLANAVAHKVLSPTDAQAEMDRLRQEVHTGKILEQIRVNPAQAVADLQSKQYDDFNPVKKQEFLDRAQAQIVARQKQALADKKQAEEDAAKQRKQAMDSEATSYESDLARQNGKATLPRLFEMEQKYRTGGEPLSRETFDKLYDLTVKPYQSPSDAASLAAVRISVNSTTPMSMSALHQLYAQGKINLNDYTEQSVTLEKNMKELGDKQRVIANEERTQNEKVLSDEFGGSQEIHALALKDLLAGSTLPDIEKKYQPVYKGTTTNEFKTARNAFDSAVQQQTNWQRTYFGIHYESNPKDDLVEKKRDELIVAAKKANRILRPAAPGTVEGLPWIQPDGAHVMSIGGQVIKVD